MSSKEQLKIMMLKEHINAVQLAEMPAKKRQTLYTSKSFAQKFT